MELSGGCACGRNVYVIQIPAATATDEQAQILFDNSSSSRIHLASPFTAWLRVPLGWFHSGTIAFYPDETHRLIRRSFVSPYAQGVRRHFCGFCGTPLLRYVEDEGAQGVVEVTLGSLFEEDLERLEGEGVLGLGDDEEEERPTEMEVARMGFAAAVRPAQHRGASWYESLVRDSKLGRLKKRRGGWDGPGQKVEWEVVEYTEGDEEDVENGESVKRRRVEVVVEEPVDA